MRQLFFILVWMSLICLLISSENRTSERTDLDKKAIQAIKMRILEEINRDRKRHGLQPVQYDSLASVVGDKHCREALNHGYQGHFGLDGSKPYHRYAMAGGYDNLSQNASAAWWWGYELDTDFLIAKALTLHRNMYNEKPPKDGHRRNILAPEHNYCGIGLAFDENGMRMTQEFLDRYVELDRVPEQKLQFEHIMTDTIWLSGKTLHGEKVGSVTVFYEPHPESMTIDVLNRTYSYSLPNERMDFFKKLSGGWHYSDGSTGHIFLTNNDTKFRFPVMFWKEQPGIYTVVIWLYEDNPRKTFAATNICFFVY